MSTSPFPCLESSPTPSHLPKPCMRKIIIFETKLVVLENILPRFSKKMGLPSKANVLENFPKQSWSSSKMICWTVSQPHSPENHPVKFLSQPCSFFRKTRVMHSQLISRLPGAHEMHYAISTIFIPIYIICIYSQITPHVIQQYGSTNTQISSLEKIIISFPMAYTHNYIPYN